MSVDLFAFDDECDIAEFWFVEDADEVLLFIGLKAQIDIATCLSKVFWILLDGAKSTVGKILLLRLSLVALLILDVSILTGMTLNLSTVHRQGGLLPLPPLLIGLTWFSINVFLIVSRSICLVFLNLQLVIYSLLAC